MSESSESGENLSSNLLIVSAEILARRMLQLFSVAGVSFAVVYALVMPTVDPVNALAHVSVSGAVAIAAGTYLLMQQRRIKILKEHQKTLSVAGIFS